MTSKTRSFALLRTTRIRSFIPFRTTKLPFHPHCILEENTPRGYNILR